MSLGGISEKVTYIMEEVRRAALSVNRDPGEITVVAVTKTVDVDRISEAVAAGLTVLGENRVQELTEKYSSLSGVDWHLIGHLQSNKVKYIIEKVSLIHSLDSLSLAREISRRATSTGRVMEALVQVNTSGEKTKFGISADEVVDFIDNISALPGLKIRGLMTIAPYVSDPEEVRPFFRKLKNLANQVKIVGIPGVEMTHLSMGMSNDYKVAVEEGATLIRLGSIIFGNR